MKAPTTLRRGYFALHLGLCPLALLVTSLAGCAQMNYDQVRLGTTADRPNRLFAEAQSRRTALGVAYLDTDMLGKVEAAVVLLSPEQRVAAKFYAVYDPQSLNPASPATYTLRGELDPDLTTLRNAGPLDTLRVIADELTDSGDEQRVRDAHAWIAAGLVRLVQQWPHATDPGPAATRITETLARVPAGGTADLSTGPDGTLTVTYTREIR